MRENYSFKKYQKELARKKKAEEKKQKKLAKKMAEAQPQGQPGQAPEGEVLGGEAPVAETPADEINA